MGNLWEAFWEGFALAVAGMISAIAANPGPWLAVAGLFVVLFLLRWLTRRRAG